MNNQELFVYIIQFAILLFIIFNLSRFAHASRLFLFSLFFSSVIYSAISAYVGYHYEYDSLRYLEDAKLLTKFLDEGGIKLYGLFFLSGGNPIYPKSYYPMLIASNTWANYTSFTIEKFYLFFALISKPNLYNISLFFGFISFTTKYLIYRNSLRLNLVKNNQTILKLVILIGGLDFYFVSGIYKENLVLFFITILYSYYHSNRSYLKFIIAFIVAIHLFFLKFELGFSIVLIYLCFRIYDVWKYRSRLSLMVIACILSMVSLFIYVFPVFDYIQSRITRFSTKASGTLALDSSFDFVSLIKRILGVLYVPMYSIGLKFALIDIYNICIILFFVVWNYFFKTIWTKSMIFSILLFLVNIVLIGTFVPNYGAQLRYRAPFVIFLIYNMIQNSNIRKKYIQ